jgi:hypothetical protein
MTDMPCWNWAAFPLSTKYGWMQQGSGAQGPVGYGERLASLAAHFEETDGNLRRTMSALGGSWEGAAADGATGAVRRAAGTLDGNARTAGAGQGSAHRYGDSFAATKNAIPDPAGVGTGGFWGSVSTGLRAAVPGVGTTLAAGVDYVHELMAYRQAEQAADQALTAHQDTTRAALAGYTTAVAGPGSGSPAAYPGQTAGAPPRVDDGGSMGAPPGRAAGSGASAGGPPGGRTPGDRTPGDRTPGSGTPSGGPPGGGTWTGPTPGGGTPHDGLPGGPPSGIGAPGPGGTPRPPDPPPGTVPPSRTAPSTWTPLPTPPGAPSPAPAPPAPDPGPPATGGAGVPPWLGSGSPPGTGHTTPRNSDATPGPGAPPRNSGAAPDTRAPRSTGEAPVPREPGTPPAEHAPSPSTERAATTGDSRSGGGYPLAGGAGRGAEQEHRNRTFIADDEPFRVELTDVSDPVLGLAEPPDRR